MSRTLRALVPFVHVTSIPRSLPFYELFGFDVFNSFQPDGAAEPVWVFLRSGTASLMLAKADGAFDPGAQATLFYVYTDDLKGLRATLDDHGIAAGPIKYPFYAPKGEFRVEDPDGWVIMVMHA